MHLYLTKPSRWRLLAMMALLVPLLSIQAGCATRSTISSIARTERPAMPAYPQEFAKRETLPRLAARPSGRLVRIDEAYWREHNELLAAALGAIERLNLRNAGAEQLWRCTAERLAKGTTGAGCPAPSKGE